MYGLKSGNLRTSNAHISIHENLKIYVSDLKKIDKQKLVINHLPLYPHEDPKD